MKNIRVLSLVEKHRLYEASVQCPDNDIAFVNKEFTEQFHRPPLSMREDFGGTAALACKWVTQSPAHTAYAIDLDPEPMNYGKETHYAQLTNEQRERMRYVLGNVLSPYEFKTDLIVAFNFSYYIFKKRRELLEYFTRVRDGLNDQGAFFIDLFGGTEARKELVERQDHPNHSYYWDCESYNPLTEECLYKIHFKKDGKKYTDVFTYDWRLWGAMELREVLEDAGFSQVVTYWEGTDADGSGDGKFYRSMKEENCESWVTYIMAVK